MFGLFKKKDPIAQLSKQYEQLMKRAHAASHQNRAEGDRLMAEADAIAQKIDQLRAQNS